MGRARRPCLLSSQGTIQVSLSYLGAALPGLQQQSEETDFGRGQVNVLLARRRPLTGMHARTKTQDEHVYMPTYALSAQQA